MVARPLPANADPSIRCNFEFNSNEVDACDIQLQTQKSVRLFQPTERLAFRDWDHRPFADTSTIECQILPFL
jgi:hypothetical protein